MQRIYRMVIASMVIATGCGGGGSITSTVTAPTAASLKSIASIPDLNVNALDSASSTNANLAVPKGLKAHLVNANTTYARAGCELRACVEEFKTQVKEFNGNKCIMEAMETNTGFQVGDGSYNYFKVLMPPEAGIGELENTSFRVKVGVVSDTLGLFLCREKSGSATQTMAMSYQVASGKFTGQITNRWPSFQDPTATDAFRIAVALATEDASKISEGDTGTLTGQFNGFWGSGQIDLGLANEAGSVTNTVDASFQSGGDDKNWGKFTSLVYGKYNGHEGCAKFSASGSYPGQIVGNVFGPEERAKILAEKGLSATDRFCWREADPNTADSVADWIAAAVNGSCTFTEEGTECFSFSRGSDNVLTAYVYDTNSATYYDDILSKALGAFHAPSINFTGDETWDCAAPGDSWSSIDVTSNAALQAAVALCFNDFKEADSSRSINSCEELERERDAESDTGAAFTGE